MNYIKEINAFYDYMELEPLSASGVSLWHTLLHMNNKARWAVEFTASSTILKLKSGLSESSFQRARKELVNRELLEYRSRGKNLAPAYRMKRLQIGYGQIGGELLGEEQRDEEGVNDGVGTQVEGQAEGEVKGRVSSDAKGQVNAEAEVLDKQKERKREKTRQNEEDAIVFYQNNFGVVSPFVTEDILSWIDDVGEELVIEAMKRGLERGKSNWGYVKQILRSWVRKGVRTVEQARAEMVAAAASGGKRGSGMWNSSGEVVPEWFLEQKRKRGEKVQQREEGAGSLPEGENVAEMLERYLSGE